MLACLLTALLAVCGTIEADPAPNIVIILADDLGYGDLACYDPASKIPTPNLDRLAAEGMRFLDAHSPSSVCTPTRYGLLTGRYCWRTELKSSVLWPWDPPLLEDERTTLPEMLRSHGYATACIGKWHLGWTWLDQQGAPVNDGWRPGTISSDQRQAAGKLVDFGRPILDGPLAHGFDTYFGDDVPNFPPYVFIEDERTVGLPTAPKPDGMFGHAGPMLPDWDLHDVMPALTTRAVRYVHEHAGGEAPFLLYMPLTAPHTPIAVADPFRGASDAGAYGDFVVEVDDAVGRVLAALDDTGVAGKTIVIFTSDNGSPARDGTNMSGPVGSVMERFGHRANGRWRGLKSDAWEAGHRVPFIVRWPGVVEAGARSEQLVCLTDVFATVADLHDHALTEDMAEDSFSLLPILGGASTGPDRDAVVHHSGNGTFAVRRGDWKLIVGNLGSGGFSRPSRVSPGEGEPCGQLYDLAGDPGETVNLWIERPRVVSELTELLDRYRREGRSRSMSRAIP